MLCPDNSQPYGSVLCADVNPKFWEFPAFLARGKDAAPGPRSNYPPVVRRPCCKARGDIHWGDQHDCPPFHARGRRAPADSCHCRRKHSLRPDAAGRSQPAEVFILIESKRRTAPLSSPETLPPSDAVARLAKGADQLGNRHIREFEPLASPFSPTCCLGRRYGCDPSLRAGPFETGAEGGS